MAAIHFLLSLLLAPLLLGIINQVKARFAGRRGKPFLQLYYDLAKLLQKGAVYSHTTSWVFRAGPILGLASVLAAMTLFPMGGQPALLSFTGDFLLAAYLLAMSRFAIITAALDTGSAFEGMGASREAIFSAMAEPVFLLGLMPLGLIAKSYSLTSMLASPDSATWTSDWPVLLLLAVAFFIVLLTENCRIPVDDPTTHLELTMIHEVMVLDHGGVDLAFIEYAAALKLWFFASLVSGILLPQLNDPILTQAALFGGILLTVIAVGITESIMARLRLVRIPQLLALAGAFAALACIFSLR